MNDAPIQNVDSFDIVGERNDGGIDLVVVCSGPLDESAEVQALLTQKLENYLATASHPNFRNVYPAAKEGPVRIVIACEHAISDTALATIASFRSKGGAKSIPILVDGSAA